MKKLKIDTLSELLHVPGIDKYILEAVPARSEDIIVVFGSRNAKKVSKNCEKGVIRIVFVAGFEETSGYLSYLKKPVLLIRRRKLATLVRLELYLKCFDTVSAANSPAGGVDVGEQLKLHLNCYVEQLVAMLKEKVPQGTPSAEIVSKLLPREKPSNLLIASVKVPGS